MVGAGPAGVAAAVFLRQRGHDVLLLDAACFPRDKVCGEGISPEAWRLLDALGAAGRVRALAPFALRGMVLTAPDGTRVAGDYHRDPAEAGFAVRRLRLDAALVEHARASGVEVCTGTRVAAVEPRADDVVLRVRGDGEDEGAEADAARSLCARLVVGADGRGSVVARALDALRPHPRLRRFAVRGHWEGVQGLGPHGEMHVGGGGYCGVAPLSPTAANVAFVLDRRAMAEAGGDLPGFYRRTLGRWPRLRERLQRARLLEPPRAVGPLALVARRLEAPGIALVGDAAGFYDPFTGEGVTLALRSAELLAGAAHEALARPGLPDLRAYARGRGAATRDKFRLNRLLQRVVAWPALADAVAHRLARRPELADRLVGIAGDFVPARGALGLAFAWDLLRA